MLLTTDTMLFLIMLMTTVEVLSHLHVCIGFSVYIMNIRNYIAFEIVRKDGIKRLLFNY